MKIRLYSATVTHRGPDGKLREEEFPVRAAEHSGACELALAYVLSSLKLDEFELRVVGA